MDELIPELPDHEHFEEGHLGSPTSEKMALCLEGREGMEPVDRKALLARVRKGEVTVLDVRPVEEYRAAHVPGALSIPLKELELRLSELPLNREIVAYCRGPYCVLAVEAVKILRARGFKAIRMEEGVQDLRAQGFPVAAGTSE